MGCVNPDEKQLELDAFCEMLIDELKSFSANRQSISSSRLIQALSGKTGVLNTLASREHLREFRSGSIKILDQFNRFFNCEHKEKALLLTRALEAADSLDQLHPLLEKITALLTDWALYSRAEKESFVKLLLELGSKLARIEAACCGLIEGAAGADRENADFTSLIESEIAGLQDAATIQDLAQVREVLHTRLENIHSAIHAKKKEDRLRKESFEATLNDLQRNIRELQSKIDRAHKRQIHLEHEALIDPLTGIANRRIMERYIKRDIKKYKRDNILFSLIFLDIDDFKVVNDTFGHPVGDKCLQGLVTRMRQVLRDRDLIARYGGDEFVVLLSNTGIISGRIVANKLATAISKTSFIYRDSEIHLSVSLGLTQVENGDSGPEQIIARADSALYEAKNKGKDRVVVS